MAMIQATVSAIITVRHAIVGSSGIVGDGLMTIVPLGVNPEVGLEVDGAPLVWAKTA